VNYYNELDPYCVQWLRNLIQGKLIPPGDVDGRDIRDIVPSELTSYTQCHFFAGIAGWPLALQLAGFPPDREVWTGSCPCQPFSQAGKRGGFADERHLWPHWFHLISQCRPPTIFGEQVAKAADWLCLVRGDLEGLGYAVGCCPVEAASAGADQLRDRYWFVADRERARWEGRSGSGVFAQQFAESGMADSQFDRRQQGAEILRRWESVATAVGQNRHLANQDRPELRHQPRRRPGPNGAGATVAGDDGVDLGGGGQGLAVGSQPEVVGGNVRDQGASAGEAGVGGVDMGSADFDGRPQGQPAATTARHGGAVESAGDFEWVLGADGKSRRVKPGVRLLADAVSGRVAVRRSVRQGDAEVQEEHWYNRIAALRAFGNAIVPQCAAQFIKAYMSCRP
jgi:DNA (cytosine-5)-methyltransferase 1